MSDNKYYTLSKPVFLVGFMGAGKTTTARRFARSCGVASLDMDSYIEREVNCTVQEIFVREGEDCFRDMETELLRKLAEGPAQLVSCGGGIVKRKKNREILKEAFVVYLRVDARRAAERISNFSTRPLFQDLEQAEKLLRERMPLYEEVATLSIDTDERSIAWVCSRLESSLLERGVLCPRE